MEKEQSRDATISTTNKVVHKTAKIPEPSLKPLPKRAYDQTPEETNAIVHAEVKSFLAPKVPEPKPTYTLKQKAIFLLQRPNIREVCHQTINAKLKGKVTWQRRQKEAGNKFPSFENRRINRSPCS
jgi:hypothetical protein